MSALDEWVTGLMGHEPVITRVKVARYSRRPSLMKDKPPKDSPVLYDIPSLDAPRESIVEGHCILSSYRLPHQSFTEMMPTDLGTRWYSVYK